MNDQKKVELHMTAMQNAILELFSVYCNQTPSEEIKVLMKAFQEHRLNLVFSMNTSADNADFFFGMVPVNGSPDELKEIFSIRSSAMNPPPGRVH